MCPWSIKPGMGDWLTYFIENEENFDEKNFFDLDPEDLGQILKKRYLLSSNDGSISIIDKFCLKGTEVTSVKTNFESLTFGVKESMPYAGIDFLIKRKLREKTEEELEAEWGL